MNQPSSRPHVDVVVVTHNSIAELEDCLRHLPQGDWVSVHVVDNASSDGTPERLKRLQEEGLVTSLLLSDENLGFARAVNLVMRRLPAGRVFLLNPDAVLEEGCLERLSDLLDRDSSIGVASPLVYSTRNVRTTTAGRQPRLWPMLLHYSGLSRIARKTHRLRGRYLFLDGALDEVERVEWVAGCAMLLSEHARAAEPLLIERWFMYAEDTEYCARVSHAGLSTVVLTTARCFHGMGKSVEASPSRTIQTMWVASLTDYYRTFIARNEAFVVVWKLVFGAGLGLRAGVQAVRGLRRGADAEVHWAQARKLAAFARAVMSS